jgi:hypothetical protein
LVNRKPSSHFLWVERRLVDYRVAIAVEIPRGVDERIHRFELSLRGAAALGAFDVHENPHGS